MPDDANQTPAEFEAALVSVRAAVPRAELTISEITAPASLAPFAVALAADVAQLLRLGSGETGHRRDELAERLAGAVELASGVGEAEGAAEVLGLGPRVPGAALALAQRRQLALLAGDLAGGALGVAQAELGGLDVAGGLQPGWRGLGVALLAADRVNAVEAHLTSFASRRPDNPITQTGVLSVVRRHGIASRVRRKRGDLAHQPLDPVVVAAPWVAAAGVAVAGARVAARSRRP